MSDLHDLIAEHMDGDPDSTAAAVFSAANVPAKWRNLFYAVVRDECRRMARSYTVSTIIGAASNHGAGDTQAVDDAGRSDFLAASIYCGPERGYVPLGEMTVADHEARIAMQVRLRGGIDADIERHRTWVDQLVAAGATCLNDLGMEVAA